MKHVKLFVIAGVVALIVSVLAPQAAFAWCTPRNIVCGAVIDSTNRYGHTDVNRYNCTGSTRYNGKADVYRITHAGGPLWVQLDWTGNAAMAVFLLGSCNQNNCLGADAHLIYKPNLNAGTYWIIVDGRTTTYNRYRLSTYCQDHQLPVELISFNASSNNGGIQLRWTVASETDNEGFTISRLAEGQSDWERIGYVAGRGSATSPADYSFVDPSAIADITYSYKLESTDMNGNRIALSETEVIHSAPVEATVSEFHIVGNYPNPFNPATTIRFEVPESQNLTLDVYDATGRLVRTLASGVYGAGVYDVHFDGSDLASGLYFARLTSKSHSDLTKLILMK
jgi:hypothetical protein